MKTKPMLPFASKSRLSDLSMWLKWIAILLAFSIVSFVQSEHLPGKAPQPVAFDQVFVKGELYQRAMKNLDRLETEPYHPENVFPKGGLASPDWPGDIEGRTILGLVLEAQATHRTPIYLDEIMHLLPQRLNAKGYIGPLQEDTINEQQLSGHGWLLRGLCEYYQWKKDPKVKTYIQGIITNLALPTAGHHRNYPINPSERVAGKGEMSGSSVSVVNGWKLSTDVGCDFIFMDGVVQAYGLFPSKELKSLIDEMIARFLEMDLVGIKAQTHATLTGLRAVIRYYEIAGAKNLLPEVEKRFRLYREYAMTENYENFNWFERPEWSEPCAIVDSYILAMQLWQYTRNPVYLEEAQLIYYNALGHTQRANGGFGCDNCPGPVDNTLSVKADEAYWCCTMRGGEGLARVIRYSYFELADTLILPSFNTGLVSFNLKNTPVTISQQTNYPFGDKVSLAIDNLKEPVRLNLMFFLPSWVSNPEIAINNKQVKFRIQSNFVVVSTTIQQGDRIDYSFNLKSGVEGPVNSLHTSPGKLRMMYGPLLLGYEGGNEIAIPQKAEVIKISNDLFQIKGTTISLSPVYHLMDGKVRQGEYRKQILFNEAGQSDRH